MIKKVKKSIIKTIKMYKNNMVFTFMIFGFLMIAKEISSSSLFFLSVTMILYLIATYK